MKNTEKSLIDKRNGPIRTFGRRHGKKLSPRQQWLIDNLLPKLTPGTDTDAILEIGFGAGEHLMQLAKDNPNRIIIGAEPFMNGVASLLSAMTTHDNLVKPEYKNIRIWPDDVRMLLSIINPSRLRRAAADYPLSIIYILHPDPWPKARHEKRRLLNSEFLNLLSDNLGTGGKIIIGTDHYEYFDWISDQLKKTKLSIINYPSSIIETRYEKKNKAGTIAPKYMMLEKKY